jgi:hypothetical protein
MYRNGDICTSASAFRWGDTVSPSRLATQESLVGIAKRSNPLPISTLANAA